MASPWGKFLCEVTVPTGGWAFGYNHAGEATVTIPAGTYDTVLELLASLDALLTAATGHAWTMTISEVGYVSIAHAAAFTWTAVSAANTTAGLKTVLGLAGTEVCVADVLTASLTHTHGWYPGTITHAYSTSRGCGNSTGPMWIPEDIAVRSVAGSGRACIVAPTKCPLRRVLRYDLISLEEARDQARGVAGMMDAYLAKSWRWYLDRQDGVDSSAPGSEINPWTEIDGDHEFYSCTLAARPELTQNQNTGRWFSVELVLNGELAP